MSVHERDVKPILRAGIYPHLDKIRALFDRPDDVKVTVIVRCPWESNADVMVGNDDVAEAVLAMQRLDAKGRVF